jgi:hypothetical protein
MTLVLIVDLCALPRFRQIAKIVGSSHNKKDCYTKYKDLKAAKKKSNKTVARMEAAALVEEPRKVIQDDQMFRSVSHSSEEEFEVAGGQNEITSSKKCDDLGGASSATPSGDCDGDLTVTDFVDEELVQEGRDIAHIGSQQDTQNNAHLLPITASLSDGRELLPEEARDIRRVLFGDPQKVFNAAWLKQNLTFSKVDGLSYGIIQHEGGPCGVLAAVQAHVLDYIYHRGTEHGSQSTNIDGALRNHALVHAISEILWNAANKQTPCLVLPSPELAGTVKWDGRTDSFRVHTMSSRSSLEVAVKSYLGCFRKRGGVVLLVYSCILSRGVERITQDMDSGLVDGAPHLMDRYGYAGQEMVNLMLVGCARSNVFDGERNLGEAGSGSENDFILRGIDSKSRIGFLTLFEHYGHADVGANLKNPSIPVWVICSESHFSVLFSVQGVPEEWPATFDLHYYDGLANQDEVIRLTIRPPTAAARTASDDTAAQQQKAAQPPEEDVDLIPPLELVIRTKWAGASVDWNGAEPIL